MKRLPIISRLLILAVVIVVSIGVLLHWTRVQAPDSSHAPLELAAPPTGGDFTLDSAAGPVRLSDLRGQVVLIYFGYTSCPDICPTNLVYIANALRALQPAELERTRVLFISVDPERDDPSRLASYVGYFHPNILGLTGTPAQVAEVAKHYGAAYRRVDDTGSAMVYLIDHSAFTYVVDPSGRLVQTLGHASPPETILAAIRTAFGAEP
ncbi:redoxin domain-containing protein [Allochromatium palmeri]|uniref:Redoxin domain-containing protein n=2 Tax=Allochromatium palmeri TaxID=231048 RepID=A0A6N8ECL4_9GAMM|nr:redoxin domain-containing protein [Allochromatium palmeri]